MRQVNIREAKSQLSCLIEAAINGEEVVINKAGTPVARIVPIQSKPAIRFGLMRGEIKIGDDFDAPLSHDLQAAFEGR